MMMKSLYQQITRYSLCKCSNLSQRQYHVLCSQYNEYMYYKSRTIGQYHSEGVPQTYQVHQRTAGRVGLSQELGGGLSKTLNLVLYGLSVNKMHIIKLFCFYSHVTTEMLVSLLIYK